MTGRRVPNRPKRREGGNGLFHPGLAVLACLRLPEADLHQQKGLFPAVWPFALHPDRGYSSKAQTGRYGFPAEQAGHPNREEPGLDDRVPFP